MVLALAAVGVVVGLVMAFGPGGDPTPPVAQADPQPAHVFVINLENTSFDRAWGPESKAPFLSKTLRSEGVLLENYYAIYPSSLPNYLAQISGQGPNPKTANDCAVFREFVPTGTAPHGQLLGKGCVYPATVPTLAGQLESKGLTWKGYMEDMATPCLHPELNAADGHKSAKIGNQYVTRHNPFMYFAEITDSPNCTHNVVNLNELQNDLGSAATTPNLAYITPNLCNDGHDNPCVDGTKGGLTAVDSWLREWVPRITGSPAFKKDGMLVVTFDEGDAESHSDTAATAIPTGKATAQVPGAPLQEVFGPGGGRVGALILSPLVRPGTTSETVYNHYSLLASIEDAFALPYLGYAATPSLNKFGPDVFNAR